MKIAIFSDFFYPELSGVTDSITLLGAALADLGHSVMFVVPRYGKQDYKILNESGEKAPGEKNIFVERLPSIHYPYSSTKQSRLTPPLGRGIWLMKRFAPDIIHTHSPFGPGLEALLASKIFHKPLVGTNHTPYSEFIGCGPVPFRWLARLASRYSAWYYNRCLFVSAPSKSLIEEMQKNGLRANSEAISNPIDLARFSPAKNSEEKAELKRRFGFSPHTILYTGRLAPEKRIDIIIKALASAKQNVPDISFVLAGHGIAENFLRNLANELGLKKEVKFLGFVSRSTLPLIYKASDLFVIMSTAESQSLSLMQAMASGLPVSGARAWGLSEYINEDNGIIIEPGNCQTLASAMIKIFEDQKLAAKLGMAGSHFALKYSAPAIAQKWESVYLNAIKSKK
jgi:glycosyltransferase involved in cell wall biosynthesis